MSSVTTWIIAVADRSDATIRLDAPAIASGAPEIVAGVCRGTRGDGGDAQWVGEAPVFGAPAIDRNLAKADLADPVLFIEARYLVRLPLPSDCKVVFRGKLVMGARSESLDATVDIQAGASSGAYAALTWWMRP
jgi:hypothetical protein